VYTFVSPVKNLRPGVQEADVGVIWFGVKSVGLRIKKPVFRPCLYLFLAFHC
jgi:hypothetical protein